MSSPKRFTSSTFFLAKGRLTGAFMILLASRVFGIVRELIVSVAFGFSHATDLFYQATFPLTALLTIAGGPFNTAFSAKLNQEKSVNRSNHVRYYARLASKVGAVLAALYGIGAAWLITVPDVVTSKGWIGVLVLAPCAAHLAMISFTGAVANAFGQIAQSAKLMFVLNASFVGCVCLAWLVGLSLTAWTLPLCYTIGAFVAYLMSRSVIREFDIPQADELTSRATPMPGLTRAFLFAGSETIVFLVTQLLVVTLATYAGAGWVSGASLAQRLCFSVNGLIISPYASLLMIDVVQGRACSNAFRHGIALSTVGLTVLAAAFAFGIPTVLQHFHYKLHGTTSTILSELLPAYAVWMIPMGVNVVVCRVMFGLKLEKTYTLCTIVTYLVANIFRGITAYLSGNFAAAIAAGALIEIGGVVTLTIVIDRHIRLARNFHQDKML